VSSQYSYEVQRYIADLAHDDRRGTAVMSLIELNTAEANDVLVNLIDDPAIQQFYIYIIMALSQRHWINPVPYVRRLFDSKIQNYLTDNHLAGIVLLQDYPHDPDTMPLLTEALRLYHGEEIWQYCTIQTLARIGTDEAIFLVAQVMQQHDDWSVRADAAMELGTSPNPLAGEILLNYLERMPADGEITIVQEALPALGQQISKQPIDIERGLRILERWLYQEAAAIPTALVVLQDLKLPQADAVIAIWQQWRSIPYF
jgi:HEAT repeat protein